MSPVSIALLAAGALVIALGMRIATLPISDRMVRGVIDAVAQSSGDRPTPEAMRAHIRKDRRRWGLYVGAFGAALIAIALIAV